ncbi:hypothetical protein NLG97_g351 [Lecanicillium saksenae]|uniref:Uncharacterized protein n=1 Tax=Lecanicillium saksenae TaxID=468837 RepID=A0ACC1R841_9HYPO|nr:hypothetical protein NLG97_g351 [Lecanicillium saksenae]
MLVEIWTSKATKRGLDEAGLDEQPALKRTQVSSTDRRIQRPSCLEGTHDPPLSGQSTRRDPFAAPMFASGGQSLDDIIADPFAAPIYRYQDGYQGQLGEFDSFLALPGQMDGILDMHLGGLTGNEL